MAGTILIVDDERDVVDLLVYNLQKAGYKTLTAFDGREALEKAHQEAPHVIVTDESLPLLTGTQLAKTLKSEGSTIPILLVTGYRSGLDTSCCNAVLGKPIEVDELVKTVFLVLAGPATEEHAVP